MEKSWRQQKADDLEDREIPNKGEGEPGELRKVDGLEYGEIPDKGEGEPGKQQESQDIPESITQIGKENTTTQHNGRGR